MRAATYFAAASLALAACGQPTPTTQPTAATNPSAAAPTKPVTSASPKAPTPDPYTGVLDEAGFMALHQLKGDQAPAPKGEMLKLSTSSAYLSLPPGAKPPLAGVLVIHEWWGLNSHIKHWADRLAADGYAALAVDLYGGQVATTPKEAMKAMKATDGKKALAILKEAAELLATDKRILAKKKASVGWCFGGRWSFNIAQAVKLDAAVVYYGHVPTTEDEVKGLRAPLLGIFGNLDKGIPPSTVDAFERSLKASGAEYTLHRYDANHAFANPSSGRYDEKSAAAAWQRTRAFLKKRLSAE